MSWSASNDRTYIQGFNFTIELNILIIMIFLYLTKNAWKLKFLNIKDETMTS